MQLTDADARTRARVCVLHRHRVATVAAKTRGQSEFILVTATNITSQFFFIQFLFVLFCIFFFIIEFCIFSDALTERLTCSWREIERELASFSLLSAPGLRREALVGLLVRRLVLSAYTTIDKNGNREGHVDDFLGQTRRS